MRAKMAPKMTWNGKFICEADNKVFSLTYETMEVATIHVIVVTDFGKLSRSTGLRRLLDFFNF